MRPVALLSAPLLLTPTTALQLPSLQPFLSALTFPVSLADYIPPTAPSAPPTPRPHALLKRQFSNTCPNNFNPCDSVGAPGLCCAEDAACAADDAGNVACCPSGAVCTGVINGVITAGTVDSNGHLVSASAGGGVAGVGGGQVVTSVGSTYIVTGSGAAGGGLVAASSPSTIGPVVGQSSGGGFIVDAGSTVATPGAGVRGAEVVSIAVRDGEGPDGIADDVHSRWSPKSLFACWRWFRYERVGRRLGRRLHGRGKGWQLALSHGM